MRIESTGIIDNRIVRIIWDKGQFESTVSSVGEDTVDLRLAQLMRENIGRGFDVLDSVDTKEDLIALHIIFDQIYDRRISVHVEFPND